MGCVLAAQLNYAIPTYQQEVLLMEIRPQISLISSFTPRGIRAAAAQWPDIKDLPCQENSPHPIACELYAFMQEDVEGRDAVFMEPIAGKASTTSLLPTSALVAMANCEPKSDAIDHVAKQIFSHFRERRIKVCAIATFLPEIVAGRRLRQAENVVAALRFLIQVAVHISGMQNHPIKTIELVCGSRMAGIWPAVKLCGDGNDQSVDGGVNLHQCDFVANRMEPNEAMNRLLEILREVAQEAHEYQLSFALELEPGPMYVLNNLDAVHTLFKAILCDPMLRPCVGMNLDIAHWMMLGPSMTDLNREIIPGVRVRDTIIHAHISGHHPKGHLGDCDLLSHRDATEIMTWLQLLKELMSETELRQKQNLAPYSGFVSLEYEVAKNLDRVKTSLSALNDLLKKL